MVMPNFLCIGMPRSGTTWLHELLADHPQVYVPRARKEVGFFGTQFDKGFEWYATFFPSEAEASAYRAIGELTPSYAVQPEAIARIAARPEIRNIILMLREPLARFRSHYMHRCRGTGHEGQLEPFLADNPDVLQASRYSRIVPSLREQLGDRRITIVIYERATRDFDYFRTQIGAALGIDPDGFDRAAWSKVVHPTRSPGNIKAGALLKQAKRAARGAGFDWLVNTAVSLGARRLYGGPAKSETVDTPYLAGPCWREIEQDLVAERSRVERMLGAAVPEWTRERGRRQEVPTAEPVLT